MYWLNALSFLAVLAALARMRVPTQTGRGATEVSWSAIGEGIRFVFRSPMILSTMLLDFLATFFASATLPIFAAEILHVGAQGLGLLYGAESIGAVIAGAAMSLISHVKRQGAILLGAVAVYGIAAALLVSVTAWRVPQLRQYGGLNTDRGSTTVNRGHGGSGGFAP